MIKLKDILNETTKKSRIKEDNFISKVFKKFRKSPPAKDTSSNNVSADDNYSYDSKNGNWKLFDFEEGTPTTGDDLDFSGTQNFVSKINSHPKMKKLTQAVGKVDHVIAKTTFKTGTGKNQSIGFQIRISDSKRPNKFHSIHLSSSKPFSSWEIVKWFDWTLTDKYIPSEYDGDIQEIAKFLFKELDAELKQRNYRVMESHNFRKK